MLPELAKEIIERFPLGFTATVAADGTPSLSPKGTFLALDSTTIGFADIRSPATMENLAHQPIVEVNFIDPFLRKAARIKGQATVHDASSDGFAQYLTTWRFKWPALAERMRAIVTINVSHAKLVTTPPSDDGATEEEMIALYKAKYAEIYP